MSKTGVLSKFDDFAYSADLWFLSALLGLTIPFAHAQSSVTVKVVTTRGAMVSDAKVMARRFDKADPTTRKVIEVLEIPETEGKFTTERLKKGVYEFFACDDGLKYEPDFNELPLGDNDSRKFTLVLGEQLRTQPIAGIGPGNKVCLIHSYTGCKATREIDGNGNIQYRGLQEHYHVEPPQACRKE